MKRQFLSALAFNVAVACTSAAIAFQSYKPELARNPIGYLPGQPAFIPYLSTNAEHTQVTTEALAGFGFKQSRVDAISEAVRDQDWKQMDISVQKLEIVANDMYSAIDHYDRTTKAPSVDAATKARFKSSSDQLRVRVGAAIVLINAGEFEGELKAIDRVGRIFHAIQDLNSHSNLHTFSDEDRDKIYDEIFTPRAGDPVLPAGFKLTAFNKDQGGMPPGDPFQHDVHALDKDDGSAAFMKTKENAILFTKRVMQRIKDGADATKFGELVAAEAPIRSATERGYQWAGKATTLPNGTAQFAMLDTTVSFPAGVVNDYLTDTVLAPPLNFFKSSVELYSDVDGNGMFLMREVWADTDVWSEDGVMTVNISPGSLPTYVNPQSIKPYFFTNGTWYPVSSSDYLPAHDVLSGFAAFRIRQGGVYALGAQIVPEPSTMNLLLLALIPIMNPRRRSRSRDRWSR
jgi:hypothetical protein